MAYERNLVLVHTPALQARSDFETIKAKLAERAPDIEVFIVDNKMPNSVSRRWAARRPSIIFSPVPLRKFRPIRGRRFVGGGVSKSREMEIMRAAGVSVPEAIVLKPDTVLDPATWGPFTVLKPVRGMNGGGIYLVRTRDVAWRDPMSWPKDDPRRGRELFAQRFIDTGLRTNHFRCCMIFGRPMYLTRLMWDAPRTFATDPDGTEPIEEQIATQSNEQRSVTFCYDEDVAAFARQVAAVFPDTPVLGVDMIREEATGKLYALEVNAGGLTWHISSNYGLAYQKQMGIDFASQFDALNIAADALMDATRRFAE